MSEEISVVKCHSAEEWLNELSPLSTRFRRSTGPTDWIFRGHADASWPLLPTAFRPKSWGFIEPIWLKMTERDQRIAEQDVLRDFFHRCDVAGLALPEDSARTRRLLLDVFDPMSVLEHQDELWPPLELWSLAALAQHYGVPTRMLDWTYSAWTAAYFAVVNVVGRVDPTGEVGVWCYSVPDHLFQTWLERNIGGGSGEVHLVTTPYAGNPNLRAQRGVHMLYAGIRPMDGPAHRPTFDLELRRIGSQVPDSLLLFTVPAGEATRAMGLLASAGISAATLFPGYAGVVQAMHESETRSNAIAASVHDLFPKRLESS